jgi:4-amino-4-deoxy-L-arabinose transferase-like glycosyltransferase
VRTGRRRRRLLLRRFALDVAIAVVVAVAIRVVGGHVFPDYDTTFELIWGKGLAHGHAPDYSIPYRPAGHPLLMFAALVASPLGREGAADVVRWLALLGAGFFVAALFRAGQAAFGTAAGVVAALLLFTRTPVWSFSLLAYFDPLAAAFVLYALALELRQPRRGGAVFVLLGLAGLIRPEVWLLAAVYWVWIAIDSRERAIRLIPLAALGPLVWIAWDLITSHSFLRSVTTDTGTPAPTSSGGHGLRHAPGALARYVGGFVRPPEGVIAVIGIGLALWWHERRAILPAALLALNAIAFVLVAATQGPLEQRYLLIAGAMTLLFAAYAITALVRLPGPARAVGVVLAVACILYSPVDFGRIGDLRKQIRVANAVDLDLRRVITARRVACALRGHIHVPDVRLRPFTAYWAGVPVERIGTAPGGSGDLEPANPVAAQLVSRSLPGGTPPVPPPPGWRLTGRCAGGQ